MESAKPRLLAGTSLACTLNSGASSAKSSHDAARLSSRTVFIELAAYHLPSYGGYVRYVVGLGVTALIGRYAILALNRYLERQQLAESMPDQARRKELDYDVALARLAQSVCPGCERPVELKNNSIDFCPHCGIGLFEHCGHCNARTSVFARFCHACGAVADRPVQAAKTEEKRTNT